MQGVKRAVIGLSSLALLTAFATPALAKKTVIVDEELDQVTAAGQPKLASAEAKSEEGVATAESFNKQTNILTPEFNGQTELRALTLNNIFGENQIANSVNVKAGANNTGNQVNTIIHSWGSAKASEAATIDAQPGAPGAPGGNVGPCVGLIAKCQAGNGGNGGNATPGQIGLLWEFSDEITDVKAKGALGSTVKAFNEVYSVIGASFAENAQTNLTALIVNNIVGFNQVANGLNISSSTVALNSASIDGGSSNAGDQVNIIQQYRGAPYRWWDAPVFAPEAK